MKIDFSNNKSYTTYIFDFAYLKSFTDFFNNSTLEIHIRLLLVTMKLFNALFITIQYKIEPPAESFMFCHKNMKLPMIQTSCSS